MIEVVKPRMPRGLQWPTILWLTAIWMALWGSWRPLIVLSGIVVALAISVVFPLPPLRLDLHIRILPLLTLGGTFFAQIVVASAQVAWITVRPAPPRSALIEVDLASRSDFVLTVVAELVSLIPGSVVVEARRSTHTLFLHVLDVAGPTDVDNARSQVLLTEQRVLRALGPRDDAATGEHGIPTATRTER